MKQDELLDIPTHPYIKYNEKGLKEWMSECSHDDPLFICKLMGNIRSPLLFLILHPTEMIVDPVTGKKQRKVLHEIKFRLLSQFEVLEAHDNADIKWNELKYEFMKTPERRILFRNQAILKKALELKVNDVLPDGQVHERVTEVFQDIDKLPDGLLQALYTAYNRFMRIYSPVIEEMTSQEFSEISDAVKKNLLDFKILSPDILSQVGYRYLEAIQQTIPLGNSSISELLNPEE